MPTKEQIYSYFDKIYNKISFVWGDQCSNSALYFNYFLKNKNINNIHLVACGYGRNFPPFLGNYTVSASDNSIEAVKLLNKIDIRCF